MEALGKKVWAIPGGHIPSASTGREPEHVSRDELQVLNTSGDDAELEITLYYADREPVGPYPLVVHPRRVRHVRFNDLIDPEAMPLDTHYACVVNSSVPVVVQFTRVDTSQAENALLGLLAYPAGD